MSHGIERMFISNFAIPMRKLLNLLLLSVTAISIHGLSLDLPANAHTPTSKHDSKPLSSIENPLHLPTASAATSSYPVVEQEGIVYDNVLETEHFYLEFSDQYKNGLTYEDEDQNNAPNKFDELATNFEIAWETFQAMGYVSPLQVYNLSKLYILIDDQEEFIESNQLGLASIIKDDEGNLVFPFIVINPNYLYPKEGVEWSLGEELFLEMNAYGAAAHELFHIIQFSYAPEFLYSYYEVNFAEGTANWITDEVFPDYELYQGYIEDYLSYPEYSLFGTQEPSNTLFRYATALWPKFLSEKYGPTLIREIFEEFFALGIEEDELNENLIQATNQALKKIGKTTLVDTYLEFAIWNYDQTRYQESEEYPKVKIHETVVSFPFNSENSSVNNYYTRPRLFGSNYIKFETENQGENLEIQFEGDEKAEWSLIFLGEKENKIQEIFRETIPSGKGNGTLQIADAGTYENIVMLVSVIGTEHPEDFAVDNGYEFTYSAILEENNDFDSMPTPSPTSEIDTLFSDVPQSHSNYLAITYLKENNIIQGYSDGTFGPEKTINRAELMKILVTSQGQNPDPTLYKNCFPDVKEEWFAVYVCYAKEKGWVQGYPDGNFKPAQTVNKVEALKMIMESRNLDLPQIVDSLPFSDTSTTEWYAPYLALAHNLEILEEISGKFNPGGAIDRGSVSENMYRLILALL